MISFAAEMPSVRQTYAKEASTFATDIRPAGADYDYTHPRSPGRGKIELRPFNMWRYANCCPSTANDVGSLVGGTPWFGRRLAEAGRNRCGQDDAVNFPTLSFKDAWSRSR